MEKMEKSKDRKNSEMAEITACIIKNDYESAKKQLLQLIKEAPYKQKSYSMLGYVYEKLGDQPKSLQMRIEANALCKSARTAIEEWERLIGECEESEQFVLAENCCHRLQRLAPDDKDNAYKRLRYLLQTGQLLKAADCYGFLLENGKDEGLLKAGLELCLPSTEAGAPASGARRAEKPKAGAKDGPADNLAAALSHPSKVDSALSSSSEEAIGDFGDDLFDLGVEKHFKGFEEFEEFRNYGDFDNFGTFGSFNEFGHCGNSANFEQNAGVLHGLEDDSVTEKTEVALGSEKNVFTREIGIRKSVRLLEHYFGVIKKAPHVTRAFKMDLFELEHITLLLELYIELEQFQKAVNFIEAVPQEDLRYLPKEVWICKAVACINLGRLKEVEETFQSHQIFESGTDEKHLFQIGRAFLSKEMASEAHKYLSRLAGDERFQFAKFWYLFGYCNFLLNRLGEAEKYLLKVTVGGESVEDEIQMNARLCLSKLYSDDGRKEMALDILKMPQKLHFLENGDRKFDETEACGAAAFDQRGLFKNRKKKRLVKAFEREKERCYLDAKLELTISQVIASIEEGTSCEMVERTEKAFDELLYSRISPRQLFSFGRFMSAARILVRAWSAEHCKERRRKSLFRLVKMAAFKLGWHKWYKSGSSEEVDNLVDIIFVGCEEMLKHQNFELCYLCMRIMISRKPHEFKIASLYCDLLNKTQFNLKYSRFIIRAAKTLQSSVPLSYLSAFCYLYRHSYSHAVDELVRVIPLDDMPPFVALYTCSCYLLHSRKRTCRIKDYCTTVGLNFAREYYKKSGKSSMACFNLAECYLFAGMKGEAFRFYQRAIYSDDSKPDYSQTLTVFYVPAIPFIFAYEPFVARKKSAGRLAEMAGADSECEYRKGLTVLFE